MTRLSELSPIFLIEVFNRARSSFLVVALWQCGDRQLNAKLSQCITYLDLEAKDTSPIGPNQPFPKLVFSAFKSLTHLRLHSHKDSNKYLAHNLNQGLLQLSPNLQTLEIHGNDSEMCLRRHDPQKGTPLELYTDYERGKSRFIDMATLFPCLTSLTLTQDWSEQLVHESDFPGLPPTLTYFHSHVVNISRSDIPFMAMLPRSLIDLRMGIHFQVKLFQHPFCLEKFWADPPPRLKSISFVTSRYLDAPSGALYLPKTLEKLPSLDFLFWPVSVLQQLPPALTTLESVHFAAFSSISHYNELKLSTRLEKLQLIIFDDTFSRLVDFIPTMPSSLTHLGLSGDITDWLAARKKLNKSSWPASLTVLDTQIPLSMLSVIPDTLTSISLLVKECDHVKIPSQLLPPGLKSLVISCYKVQSISIEEDMPLHLQTLHFSAFERIKILGSAWRFFPASLSSLGLLSFYFDDADLENVILPSKLLQFAAVGWRIDQLHKLPSCLETLMLSDLRHCDLSSEAFVSHLLQLPMGLKELQLSSDLLAPNGPPAIRSLAFVERLYRLHDLQIDKLAKFILD